MTINRRSPSSVSSVSSVVACFLCVLCALLSAQNATRRYTYLDLKGQDCIIGCATEEELRRLRKLTGMNFSWLE